MKKFLCLIFLFFSFIVSCYAIDENVTMTINDLNKIIGNSDKKIIPNNNLAKAYYMRGFIYETEYKDNIKALTDYNNTVKYNPYHKKALKKICKIKFEMQDNEGALADLKHLIKQFPNDADIHYFSAFIYSEAKQYENTIKECTESIKIQNKNPDAFLLRGITELRLKQKDKGYQDLEYAKRQFYEKNNIEKYKNVVNLITTLKDIENTPPQKKEITYTSRNYSDISYPTYNNNYEVESQLKQLNNNLQNINHTLYTMPY